MHRVIASGQSQEISRAASNDFLKSQVSFRSKYEESKEAVETKREVNSVLQGRALYPNGVSSSLQFCLNEYQQQERAFPRRQAVSSFCAQYCNETNDCQSSKGPFFGKYETSMLKSLL